MEGISKSWKDFLDRSKTFWNELTGVKRIALLGGVAGFFIVVLSLIMVTGKKDYEYLYVNLSSEDTVAITDYLRKNNYSDYVIDGKGLKVPSSAVIQYRLKLSQEGLPSQGYVGWEKFDDSSFTRTEFERQINKMRAIQGELGRTISSIDGITSARVHIVTPKTRLFEKDKKEPTAAVYIKSDRGRVISKQQIKGIVHLISKSIEGLNPRNISIIDFEGNLLTEERSDDPDTRENKEMIEFKHRMERNLERKVKSIVGRVVGQDRVDAKIDLKIDFTKEEKTVSDIDPDRLVVISQNTTNQKASGTGLNPTGIPGSKSNVPGDQEAVNLATSGSQNTRDTELVNYEVAKTISHKILPSGTIHRISAAVIVDGKQAYPSDGTVPPFEARTDEEMKKIEELVKSAIGFVGKRDEVKVHNMMFEPDFTQVQTRTIERQEEREYVSTLSIAGALALGMILFFAFVVRPYLRWLAYDPSHKEEQNIIEEFKPDLELTNAQNIQVKEDVPFEKLTPQEQVIYLAKNEPERTTEALRMLLNPHQG